MARLREHVSGLPPAPGSEAYNDGGHCIVSTAKRLTSWTAPRVSWELPNWAPGEGTSPKASVWGYRAAARGPLPRHHGGASEVPETPL